ncbi:MmgE/PrpD family protein [Roseomonas gilardii]|uniref:MmgE/PrpD family protein n=1 Tax=Roseomonas gilardii TaxID=257708 RepID=UPI0009F8E720|nr:MmgE/PrpD family protein [Roseomonas gilardii]
MSELAASETPLLSILARYVTTLEIDRIPVEARWQAALCLLDTVGCIAAGSRTPEATMIQTVEGENGFGKSRLLGSNLRLPSEAAARIHGYAGDVFELNDLIGGHASIGNVAAVLAAAEDGSVSGARLLTALIAGIEVTCRVYTAVYPHLKPYTDVAMVIPGIVSAIGAAAAVAVLQEQPEPVVHEALAIAGALTTWCPAEAIFGDGGTVKPLLFGAWPAAVGLRAVCYARRGMTGPAQLLDSSIGLYATLGRCFDRDVITDVSHWYLLEPRRKLHACCGYIHSALDTLITLRREIGVEAMNKGRLHIEMPAYVIPAVSKRDLPSSANEARFHAEYCLALVACGDDVVTPDHSLNYAHFCAREDVKRAISRITIRANSSLTHYHQSILEFEADGLKVRRANHAPKGSPQNPMTEEDVIAKFLRLAAFPTSHDYAARMLKIEKEIDCSWIFDDMEAASGRVQERM